MARAMLGLGDAGNCSSPALHLCQPAPLLFCPGDTAQTLKAADCFQDALLLPVAQE
jgi:hypothetical protein